MQMKSILIATAAACLNPAAHSQDFAKSHAGSNNPLSEGFTTITFLASVSTNPVVGDQGHDAWELNALTTATQYSYVSGAFTAAEKASIAANGFNLSFSERILQGPAASVYSPSTPYVLSAVGIDTGTRRYQVFLGLNANGDTVAVLPTSINNVGAGSRIQAPGASYTLSGLDNGYHDYILKYFPETQTASLFVDGQLRLSNYSGYNNFISNHGLGFSAFSAGTARFANVSLVLSAVPEPSTNFLMFAGLSSLLLFSRNGKPQRCGPSRQAVASSGRADQWAS